MKKRRRKIKKLNKVKKMAIFLIVKINSCRIFNYSYFFINIISTIAIVDFLLTFFLNSNKAKNIRPFHSNIKKIAIFLFFHL